MESSTNEHEDSWLYPLDELNTVIFPDKNADLIHYDGIYLHTSTYGDIYICGNTFSIEEEFYFDPWMGESLGGWIAKLSSIGTLEWATRLPDGYEFMGRGQKLTTDQDGNIYALAWNPAHIAPFHEENTIVVRYSSSGESLKSVSISPRNGNWERPQQIEVDTKGYVYVASDIDGPEFNGIISILDSDLRHIATVADTNQDASLARNGNKGILALGSGPWGSEFTISEVSSDGQSSVKYRLTQQDNIIGFFALTIEESTGRIAVAGMLKDGQASGFIRVLDKEYNQIWEHQHYGRIDYKDLQFLANGNLLAVGSYGSMQVFDKNGTLNHYDQTVLPEGSTISHGRIDSEIFTLSEIETHIDNAVVLLRYPKHDTGVPSIVYTQDPLIALEAPPAIPEDQTVSLRGNSLYAIIQGPTWTIAESNSASLGGHLVYIESESENEFLVERYAESVTSLFPRGTAWIGVTDESDEGIWRYSDGSDLQYSNWGTNVTEPNGGSRSNYAEIALGGHEVLFSNWKLGGWNDIDNSVQGYGIAEIPLTLSIDLPETPTEGAGEFITSINLSAGTEASGNLADGATVFWSITGIDAADLATGSLTGSGTITNGKLEIQHSLVEDADTDEDFEVSVYSDLDMTQQIGTTDSRLIHEVSTPPEDPRNKSLKLSGINYEYPWEYVVIPATPPLSISGEFTVASWVYRENSGGDWRNLYNIPDAHLLEFTPEGGIRWRAEGNIDLLVYANGPVITEGSWAHVAITVRNEGTEYQGSIYVNGNLVGNSPSWQIGSINNSTGVRGSASDIYLGILWSEREGNADPWAGGIDNFQIWNTALTNSEIAEVASNNLGIRRDALVAEYTFESDYGTEVFDTSGKGNHGTLVKGETLPPINAPREKAIRGNSLYTIVDGPLWTQAEANSVKLGGHLIAINNADEQSFIQANNLVTENLWIGNSDAANEGVWKWVNGDTTTYSNWQPGEPNNQNDEDYGTIYATGKWNDGHESGLPRGIAEIPFIRRGDSAYVIVEGPTWEEAEANAVALGGHLVTINDAEENAFATQAISHLDDYGIYIGATDVSKEGIWKTPEGAEITYANWNIGEPNGFSTENYAMIYPGNVPGTEDYRGKWNDTYFFSESGVSKGLAEIKLAPNNTPTGTPTISGDLKVGSTITIDASTIQDADNHEYWTPTYQYAWEIANDPGMLQVMPVWEALTTADATDGNETLEITDDLTGKLIRGVVSYLDGYGTNEVITTNNKQIDLGESITIDHEGSRLIDLEPLLQRQFGAEYSGRFDILEIEADSSGNLIFAGSIYEETPEWEPWERVSQGLFLGKVSNTGSARIIDYRVGRNYFYSAEISGSLDVSAGGAIGWAFTRENTSYSSDQDRFIYTGAVYDSSGNSKYTIEGNGVSEIWTGKGSGYLSRTAEAIVVNDDYSSALLSGQRGSSYREHLASYSQNGVLIDEVVIDNINYHSLVLAPTGDGFFATGAEGNGYTNDTPINYHRFNYMEPEEIISTGKTGIADIEFDPDGGFLFGGFQLNSQPYLAKVGSSGNILNEISFSSKYVEVQNISRGVDDKHVVVTRGGVFLVDDSLLLLDSIIYSQALNFDIDYSAGMDRSLGGYSYVGSVNGKEYIAVSNSFSLIRDTALFGKVILSDEESIDPPLPTQRIISLPADLTAKVGQIIEIPININQAQDLQAFDLTFAFDPTLFAVPTSGGLIRGGSLTEGWTVIGNVLDNNTAVKISGFAAMPLSSVEGDLAYLRLQVNGDAPRGEALLDLVSASLNENELSADIQDGSLTITAPKVSIASDLKAPVGGSIGIPISIDDATDLQSIDLVFAYDPSTFTVPSAGEIVTGSDLTGNWSFTANTTTPGEIKISGFGTTPLGAGEGGLINLNLKVNSGIETGTALLDLVSASFNEGAFTADLIDGTLELLPPTFQVMDVRQTASGLALKLSEAPNLAKLNLYDGQDASIDLPDLRLTRSDGSAVENLSLHWKEETSELYVVHTDSLTGITQSQFDAGASPFQSDFLASGDYTLVIDARSDGLISASSGELIDGNGDGITGDAFSYSFTKTAPANLISMGDTARGSGQVLGLNGIAESNGISGLPVLISTTASIRQLRGTVTYDATVFNNASLALGRDLPEDWTIDTQEDLLGSIAYNASGTTAITGTDQELFRFDAVVSQDAEYASTTLIEATAEAPEDPNLTFEEDPSLVVLAYAGDTTGNGGLSSLDASRVQRVVVELDSGFDPYDTIAPTLIGDTTGNGTLSSLDASRIQQEVVGLPVTSFPSIPEPPPIA